MPFSNNDSMAETSEGQFRIQVAVSVHCVKDKGTNTEDPNTDDKAVQTVQNEDELELRPNEQRIDKELKKQEKRRRSECRQTTAPSSYTAPVYGETSGCIKTPLEVY